MTPTILVVDDSVDYCVSLTRALTGPYCVVAVHSAEDATAKLSPPPDLILLDLRLRPDSSDVSEALRFLQSCRQTLPGTPVLIVTAHGDVDKAVECMRLGASDFVEKGRGLAALRVRLERALEHARLEQRVAALEGELEIVAPRELVGDSPQMHEVKAFVAAAAQDGNVTVLIEGETGTGKELIARAIHATGPRRSKPFIGVAVAALPGTMVEAELFGYERGAFTGAQQPRTGYFERADGSVLFLDEIDELESNVQVKLLRFLEERVITRLGGTREIPVDVQVVAASNDDLRLLVQQGRFRDDLYHRLRVLEIRLPPLRDRRDDIPLLVNHYFQKLGGPARGLAGVEPATMDLLCRYNWPGNVRELRNVLESAIIKAGLRKHRRVEAGDLPAELREPQARNTTVSVEDAALKEALARTELAEVERALEKTAWKKTQAWKLLGLNDRYALRRRVLRLLEDYPNLSAQFPRLRDAYRGSLGQRKRD